MRCKFIKIILSSENVFDYFETRAVLFLIFNIFDFYTYCNHEYEITDQKIIPYVSKTAWNDKKEEEKLHFCYQLKIFLLLYAFIVI